MPIYAYKCSACGHAKDVLQKISDDLLTDCPACHAATFTKQLTAAGFQLKGSGWYATDFKGGSHAPAPAASEGGASTDGASSSGDASGGGSSGGGSSGGGSGGTSTSSSEGTSAVASSPVPAATSNSNSTTSAASCGASCACH
ncbi:MAG: zinc ribbon domain-containing protein [Burkholderiales bacterium]|nr:zinc ribbon domain-containing protein [Burkholderiales bacterium]